MSGDDKERAGEWEIGQSQCLMVDTCFEESQYEAAIDLLEQMRSPLYRPPSKHIRQLLYLSLHSTSEYNAPPSQEPAPLGKAVKAQALPSAAAITAARRILLSFAATNTPEGIARALPHYRVNQNCTDEDVSESTIAKDSMCIKEAKNCWLILPEGFIQRNKPVDIPKGKGKRRQVSPENHTSSLPDHCAVVGENSWPALDWLLALFERDESLNEVHGSSLHSPQLALQLPSRRETAAPLSIVLYCFQQNDLRRQRMGSRLLTLLINLSTTPHLDFSILVTSIFNRLSASFTDGTEVLTLLASLAPSATILPFKIALCQKFISETTKSASSLPNGRPKPQARVQPRAVRLARETTGSWSDRSPSQGPSSSAPLSSSARSALPTTAEIWRLLRLEQPSPFPVQFVTRMKFELFAAYGILQAQTAASEKDRDWLASLRRPDLGEALDGAFGRQEAGGMYRTVMEGFVSMWIAPQTN